MCAAEASAAGLPGTYRAALETASGPAADRFDLNGPPWRRVDGVLLAPTAAAVFSSADLSTFLSLRADGTSPVYGSTWRGNQADHCADWTATTGAEQGGAGDALTTARAQFDAYWAPGCQVSYWLICLEE